MACVESAAIANADSEMEEGEIVDDLDELSDISSEEEFLLRQRLEVLESYNNVLERKKAKNTSFAGDKKRKKNLTLCDLSEISASELEDVCRNNQKPKDVKHIKTYSKQKKKKEFLNSVTVKRKTNRKKKKLQLKVISESSEESDDEYRNKRRKLANAVSVKKDTFDKSSLKTRLNNMIHGFDIAPLKIDKQTETERLKSELDIILPLEPLPKPIVTSTIEENITVKEVITNENIPIDLCTDDELRNSSNDLSADVVDGACKNADFVIKSSDVQAQKNDSDEDLELLRQHALNTKTAKVKKDIEVRPQKLIHSEDEDSDTAELRLICLKSAFLKEAIEMKKKQKLRKRLSQSSTLHDELLLEEQLLQSDNNTDIEYVDMDIGSDVDEKSKLPDDSTKENINVDNTKSQAMEIISKQDELDEDEDLLRANLLTSLSNKLPHLVDPEVINNLDKENSETPPPVVKKPPVKPVPEEKKIIITVGESDSEAEHEATKNLTKMHMKLSEQKDFQLQLDMFLKSARMQVENNTLPDVVQKPITPKTPTKYVPKAVNHLPKSEQNEYKSLIKRMAELEKIKQARQSAMDIVSNAGINMKDTVKPRNLTIETTTPIPNRNSDHLIASSRKKIAEESAKILKLREEEKKLTQKYKIVASELKNLSTAISFNKKEQRTTQNRLTKIRLHHQSLLRSSNNLIHSNRSVPNMNVLNNKINAIKQQKENIHSKNDYKNPQALKTLKVSVVNDFKEKCENPAIPNARISIEVDVSNNKKTVTVPNMNTTEPKDNRTDNIRHVTDNSTLDNRFKEAPPDKQNINNADIKDADDYQSPLQALQNATWNEDPNAILCPFEVGGNCKDADCKYMHPKNPQ